METDVEPGLDWDAELKVQPKTDPRKIERQRQNKSIVQKF